MAEKKQSEKFAARPSAVAEELLEPVLSFLQQAGISESDAAKAFSSAWARSSKRRSAPVMLESLEEPQPYVDLVTAWSRNSAYLGKDGLPRDLPVRGARGFAAMVKSVAPALDAKKALLLLHAYGNIEKLSNGKVRLTKPFFHIKSDTRLAFEPSVRFLLDAARNVKGSLRDPLSKSRSLAQTQNFWRTVDSTALPPSRKRAYVSFVKALSLTFLQDIDDWLSENASATKFKRRSERVGLGLFTIGVSSE